MMMVILVTMNRMVTTIMTLMKNGFVDVDDQN